MDSEENSLTISAPGALRKTKQPSNTIVFPKELREAIPAHSSRVLEFDRVTGATNRTWISYNPEWLKAAGFDTSRNRAQISLLAHETGKLSGQFEIGIDLDAETMRALGKFLIGLADKADAKRP